LNVIPVIDVLNGKVVHAVRGRREEYRQLESIIVSSVETLEVAGAFKNLGFSELYVADLDAIIDCSTNFEVFKQVFSETGLRLMVDAGVTEIERGQKLLENGVSRLVIGTETLKSKGFVRDAVKRFGSRRVIISLDLEGDKVVTKPGLGDCCDAMSLLREFKGMGVSQVIVLDLTRVGSGEGVNVPFVKRVIEEVGVDVCVGGGIRDLDDLLELKNLGVSSVLVATALHNGNISIQDLKQNGLL
jgi:phosphoribosylformimino-5-aminoimidazole carboxamide ribotide isomerase